MAFEVDLESKEYRKHGQFRTVESAVWLEPRRCKERAGGGMRLRRDIWPTVMETLRLFLKTLHLFSRQYGVIKGF